MTGQAHRELLASAAEIFWVKTELEPSRHRKRDPTGPTRSATVFVSSNQNGKHDLKLSDGYTVSMFANSVQARKMSDL